MKNAFDFDDPGALTFDDRPAPTPPALPSARRLVVAGGTRRCRDLRGNAAAVAAMVLPLPSPGEAVHLLLDGRFILAEAIPVVLDAIGPSELAVTTLGMSTAAAALIAGLVADGSVTRCSVIVSQFFSQQDRKTCDQVCQILRCAGAAAAVARSHCKVLLFAPAGSPDRYTCEGSSNLRSSVNLEQTVWTNSAEVYGFHRGWIQELLAAPPL
jgi:hypothetical protein